MRVIQTDALNPGDIIGRALYSENGNLLLGKGTVLTAGLIQRIQDNHIVYLYIEDEISKGIEPKGIIDDETMLQSIKTIKETMKAISKIGGNSKLQGKIPLKHYFAVENVVKELIRALEENKDVLYTVTELMGTDMYTYRHSVNVAVLSILVSQAMGYSPEIVKNIAMGGLLHDIGKVRVPAEILNKPDVLTTEEFDEMMKHPEYGYEMVKNDKVLSAMTKGIIKSHHEKRDGTGYMNGVTKDEIPDYVSIITICDMYDAMTTDRCYRKRMPIHSALEILMAESVYKIDATIYRLLVDNICLYPIGSTVVLSDGREGIVMEYRKVNPTRPKLRLIEPPFLELDLEDELTLFVLD